MNKSIIALAVASAATMASVAQAENTTLYGRVAMQYTFDDDKAENNRSHVGNAGSRFGIKGTDDLGGGLEAFYKYENRIAEDGAGLTTKKLYVGLKGDSFGSISFGTQNLPHDGIGNHTDPMNSVSVQNRSMGDAVGRMSNSVVYVTPDMSGFTASAAIVVGKVADNEEVDLYNIAAEYANNGIYAGLSYAATGDNDKNVLGLGLGYESGEGAGDFNVGVLVERTEFDAANYEDVYVRLGGNYNMTDVDSVYASFDMLDVDGTDVDPYGVSVGYQHKLSNRTKVWAEYGYQDRDLDIKDVEDGRSKVSLGLRTDF